MIKLLLVALVQGVLFVCATDPKAHPNWPPTEAICGISYSDRIVGGINASLGQYPWMARIGYNKGSNVKYECGGAIVSKDYILTASHCLTNLEPGVNVVSIILGEHNSETEVDCENDACADPIQKFKPSQIITHPEYVRENLKHDIGLIKLDHPAVFSDWIVPVCLPQGSSMERDYVGEIAEVAGWGLMDSDDDEGSTILQTVKLPFIPVSDCVEQFKTTVQFEKEVFCVGGEKGKDSCSGDSGGPLVKAMSSPNGPRYFVLGVVSVGSKKCGDFAAAALYTNVMHYLTWILDNMK